MEKPLSAAVLVLLAVGASAEQAKTVTNPVVSKVAAEFVAAFNAKDAARTASLYTDDAVLMPPNQPPVRGRANIEAWFKQSFARGASGMALSPFEQGVAGDTAYDAGQYSLSVSLPSGETLNIKGKYLVLLKKVGGQWKVAYDIDNPDAPPAPPPAR